MLLYSLSAFILISVGLLLNLNSSEAAYCGGSPQPGERKNEFEIFDGNLTFVRSVKNAALYEAGPLDALFPIVHVFGSPYDMGYAQGSLQKQYLIEFVSKTWTYIIQLVVEEMGPILSPEMQALIVEKGMEGALDWTAEVTAPFTPQEYFDEMRGLADASGVEYQMILRLNMFAELTKASCSFFGAWGEATRLSSGKSYQLRALDYDIVGPFKDYPQVTIYHPQNGVAFANVGWPGSIGVLTGFSEAKIGISEIGVYFADASFGQGTRDGQTQPEKVNGEPWMFVLRDVLQYEESLDSAINRISTSERTCNLIIGVGDGETGIVNGIEYSGVVAVPYNDTTLLPVNESWHPQIPGVVYNGMDWNCPGYTQVLGEQLQKFHGSIDEKVTVSDILPTVQTGNLHIAIYDLTDSKLYLSFARSSSAPTTEPEMAYERQFTSLDMNSVFSIIIPQSSSESVTLEPAEPGSDVINPNPKPAPSTGSSDPKPGSKPKPSSKPKPVNSKPKPAGSKQKPVGSKPKPVGSKPKPADKNA